MSKISKNKQEKDLKPLKKRPSATTKKAPYRIYSDAEIDEFLKEDKLPKDFKDLLFSAACV